MTPEERLFKVVEAGALAEGSGPAPLTARASRLMRLAATWEVLRKRVADAQPIRRVNQILMVLLVACGVYGVVDSSVRPRRMRRLLMQAPSVGTLPGEEEPTGERAPLEEYLEVIQRRDVFRPAGAVSAAPAAPAPAVVPARNIRLVGIAWDASPEAMIYDPDASQTYVLKEGQRIRTLVVETIRRDGVTLRMEDGQVVELK